MNTIKLVQITKGVVSTRYSALFLCLLPADFTIRIIRIIVLIKG